VGAEELPVLFANQFVAQVGDTGEIFLTVGQVVPPAIIGQTEEERREQAENIQYVQVKPIARLAMTPEKLRELKTVLEITEVQYEKKESIFGDPRKLERDQP